MATYTQTYTFINGITADGGQVNTEIKALGDSVNSITNDQVSGSAAIAETKLANGTRLRCSERQGGSATDWTSAGLVTRSVATPLVQCGCFTSDAVPNISGNFSYSTTTITFPTAYTNPPLVFATAMEGTGWCKCAPTTTNFGCQVWGITSSTPDIYGKKIQWIAIGE